MHQKPKIFILTKTANFFPKNNTIYSKNPTKNLITLAHALATSPLLSAIKNAIIVVRPLPYPLLCIAGFFNKSDEERFKALRWLLDKILPYLRYISYSKAEQDCEQLSRQLIAHFSQKELNCFRFASIPRGGHIVLGILSYFLSLRHTQLKPPYPVNMPLVIVDDCAISGAHFKNFLKNYKNHQVIFAHLYSHPDLRAAIVESEPQVLSCISAHNLYDHAPDRFGTDYFDWKERWLARLNNSRYWIGQPDHICFAWNEPDIAIWNQATEQLEGGWHLVPPELCLKNRTASGTKPLSVQVQPDGKGPIKPSAHTIFATIKDEVVISNIETKSSYSLISTAADMWRTLLKHGNLDDAVNSLLKNYNVNESTLRMDMEEFIEDICSKGLLEKA